MRDGEGRDPGRQPTDGADAGAATEEAGTGATSPGTAATDGDLDAVAGEGDRIHLVVLLALGAGAAYVIGILLAPFLPALVTSAVLAALVYPAHRRLADGIGQESVAALISTIVVFFLVLIPLLGLSLVLINEVGSGIDWLAREMAGLLGPGGRLRDWIEAAAGYLGMEQLDLTGSLSQQMQQAVSLLAGRTLSFLSGLGGWLIQAGAALFALYYLLRDGGRLVSMLRWLVPLDPSETEGLIRRARDVTYATVYGNVVVAMVQGLLGGLAFWVLGIPAAALWGTVMGLLSLLPAVSAPLVWGPAAVILIATDQMAKGLLLLGFGALIISTVDNYLRAVLVSDRAQLHPLVVFFSVLGGLLVFGAVGIFVGPVLFVLCLSVIEMARVAMGPSAPSAAAEAGGLLMEGGPVLVEPDAADEPPGEGSGPEAAGPTDEP